MTNKQPNFFILGAAKAGTTSLYHYIKQHPDIYMSPVKETHYFSFGGTYPDAKGPGDTVNTAILDYGEYLQLFKGVRHETVIGEASPTYLYIEGTAERLHEYNPDAKLIASLRNPIDRAYSAFMHLVRDGRETESDFRKALTLQDDRRSKKWGPLWQYTAGSMYSNAIESYQKLFRPEQLHFIIYDDFKSKPMDVVRQSFNFLGVDSRFTPDISFRVNVSGDKKSKVLDGIYQSVFERPNPLRFISRKVFSDKLRFKFTSTLRNANLKESRVDDQLRQELIELFRNDVLRVQDLIQRDLSHWL